MSLNVSKKDISNASEGEYEEILTLKEIKLMTYIVLFYTIKE